MDGLCPEHVTPPEQVAERNWFFRLSRFQDELRSLVERGRLRIEPEHRRNETLGLIRSGLADFSVSRSRERARGWGIPVLSKSRAESADPDALASRYGTDALRWWFLRDVPRAGDADFREEPLAARANELADDLGNVVNRTITLVNRFRPDGLDETATPPDEAGALLAAIATAPETIAGGLDRLDLRAAAGALWSVVTEADRLVSATRPWELGRVERQGDGAPTGRLDAVLVVLLGACRAIVEQLQPFLPEAAARMEDALERRDAELGRALFRKAEPLA